MIDEKVDGTVPEEKEPVTGAVVAVLALAGIVVALMQTLVIPIIPHLPEYLDADPGDTAWVITATLLAGAVATPVMGRLGDMFGKRRMLLISIAVMVVGSVIAALSSTVLPVIIGRTLQGLAAGVIPLGISVMRDVLPKEKLAGAVATMSASLGVGGALGLPIAAALAEYADWHILFWVSAVMGVISAIAVIVVVPESEDRAGGGFDFGGALLLSGGLVALLVGVSKGADWGWGETTTLVCFAVAAVLFILWAILELRLAHPLVDLRVAARPQVLFTNVASVLLGFAMFAASMVFPQMVQMPEATGYGMGESMLVAGLVMLPFGLMLLVAAPLSSLLTNRFGPKISLMSGAVVVAAGYVVGVFLLHSIWQLIVVGVIIGFGVGLAYGAMPALIMGAVPVSQTGAANSFNTLMRSLGTSFASAIAGVIVAQMTMTLGPAVLPNEEAFQWVMAIAAGAAALALIVVALIPRPKPEAVAANETAEVPLPAAEPAAADAVESSSPAVAGSGPSIAQGSLSDDDMSLVGIVATSAAQPLGDAAITVTDSRGRQAGRATVDADGAYAVADLAAGTYTVIATAPDRAPQAISVSIVEGMALRRDFTLGGGGVLRGIVGDGVRRLPANLVVTDRSGQVLTQTNAGSDGEFVLDGLSDGDTVAITASAAGYQPSSRLVTVTGRSMDVIEFALTAVGGVQGYVRTVDGRALAGATVSAIGPDQTIVASMTTDADGWYRIEGLDDARYTLVANMYEPKAVQVSVAAGQRNSLDIELGAAAEKLSSGSK